LFKVKEEIKLIIVILPFDQMETRDFKRKNEKAEKRVASSRRKIRQFSVFVPSQKSIELKKRIIRSKGAMLLYDPFYPRKQISMLIISPFF
jgi:hypothetical protein